MIFIANVACPGHRRALVSTPEHDEKTININGIDIAHSFDEKAASRF